MTIVINAAAKPVLLGLKLPYLRKLVLRLYQNDYTPIPVDEASSYVEADFTGYEPQHLDDLSPAYLNGWDVGESDTGPHIWLVTLDDIPNDIYGYYVTDENGYLIFAERDADAPTAMVDEGDTYTLIINFLEDYL
jgi:hypothetical protein